MTRDYPHLRGILSLATPLFAEETIVLAVSSRQFARAVYDKPVYNVLDDAHDPRQLGQLVWRDNNDSHHFVGFHG